MKNPGKKVDISSYLLTDDFSEEGLTTDKPILNYKNKTKNNTKEGLKSNGCHVEINDPSNKKSSKKYPKEKLPKYGNFGKKTKIGDKKIARQPNDSNVEFIIVDDDENDERKLVINLELKLKDSIDGVNVIKIDFEIGQDIYLDLIKELLK